MDENQLTIVKEYEDDNPKSYEVYFLLDTVNEICRDEYFHSFEYSLVYDNKFTTITNNEEVILTITHRKMELENEHYAIVKKSKKLNEIVPNLNK